MSLPSTHSTTMVRTVSMSSEPSPATVLSTPQYGTLRAVNVAPSQLSSVQYVNGAVDATALHGNVRYLVPVQRASESYVVVNQSPQMLTPVYLQNVQRVQRVSVGSLDETDTSQQISFNGQTSSVSSHPSSPIKTPEPTEVLGSSSSSSVHDIRFDVKHQLTRDVKTDFEFEPVDKLDNRFFGELLAEVFRKNCDIHTCVSEHVSKICGRKHLLDHDYKAEKEDIEHLIPKGVSELTKQQIRYLLQTRTTAEKTMRMLLSTFTSLREDLVHLQDDLRRLESEKEQLERDLSFKAEQVQQYERLVESVRDNNRQLQGSLKESAMGQRSLESQLMNNRSTESGKDFRIKDLESSKRALEQENELLRKKLEGQYSSSTLEIETKKLSRNFEERLRELREAKDKELSSMRSQLLKIQTEYTTEHTADKNLQLKITELLNTLQLRESTIRRLEEEIRRMQQDKKDSSITQTVITKRFENQYPILGLLSDDYQYTPSPVRESKTVIIKKTGEMTKKEYSMS